MEKKLFFFRKLRQLNQQYLRHLSTIKQRNRNKNCLKTAVKIDEQRPDVLKNNMPLVFDNYQENHLPVVVYFFNLS
jgi:hypothetical protein